jgi:hypothetical protein
MDDGRIKETIVPMQPDIRIGFRPTRSERAPQNIPVRASASENAICRVAEPIALTSIFPYSWVMVKDFHMDDGNNAYPGHDIPSRKSCAVGKLSDDECDLVCGVNAIVLQKLWH